MTNMLRQSQALRERIAALKEWSTRAHEAQALEKRRTEWNEIFRDLQRTVEQLDWLDVRGHAFDAHEREISLARKWIGQARQVLSQGQGVEQLTQADGWAKTLNTTKKCVELLQARVTSEWKKSIEAKGSFRPPAVLDASLPKTPANRQVFTGYSTVFATYQRLTRQDAPNNAGDCTQLKLLVGHLEEISAKFDFNVPEAVNRFLVAVNTVQGAPLALLTDEVRDWLKVEGQMDSYTIKNRP